MGRREKHWGIILRRQRTSEANRVLDIIRSDGRLMQCVARGAAKSKKRFVGALEPFTSAVFRIHCGRGRPSIEAVDELHSRFGISHSVKSLAVASCICEWLLRTPGMLDSCERELRIVADIMDLLEREDCKAELIMFVFEVKLLQWAGCLPSLMQCPDCGKAFADGEEIVFSNREGGLIHSSCYGNVNDELRVHSDVRRLMRVFETKDPITCSRIKTNKRQNYELNRIIVHLLEIHFGFRVMSRGMVFD